MLLPQVPGVTRQKVAAKLGFDLKLLAGNIETERSTLDSRVARVEAVEADIRASEKLGTPEAPSSWIAGTEWSRTAMVGEGAVLFVSEDPKWLLALGGSTRHLIGAVPKEGVGVPYSFLDTLIDQLKLVAEEDPGYALQLDERVFLALWDLVYRKAPGHGFQSSPMWHVAPKAGHYRRLSSLQGVS